MSGIGNQHFVYHVCVSCMIRAFTNCILEIGSKSQLNTRNWLQSQFIGTVLRLNNTFDHIMCVPLSKYGQGYHIAWVKIHG